jgi:hypothetical protein
MTRKSKKLTNSMIAGALGGLVAAYAMNRFQSLLSASTKKPAGGDDATVKTADAISRQVADRQLTSAEKEWAGPAVHYTTGLLLGTVYGALVILIPVISDCFGTIYGTAVWLVADEVAVPALGLGPKASHTPPLAHAEALSSHLVFGSVVELVRRVLLKAF